MSLPVWCSNAAAEIQAFTLRLMNQHVFGAEATTKGRRPQVTRKRICSKMFHLFCPWQKSWQLILLQRKVLASWSNSSWSGCSLSCKCSHLYCLPVSLSSRRSSSCFPVLHPSTTPLSFPPLPKELEHRCIWAYWGVSDTPSVSALPHQGTGGRLLLLWKYNCYTV